MTRGYNSDDISKSEHQKMYAKLKLFPLCSYSHLGFTLCFTVILGKSHYILYGLVAAMQPRMLVTFDEELRPLPVSVRVGQVMEINFLGEKKKYMANCVHCYKNYFSQLKAFEHF